MSLIELSKPPDAEIPLSLTEEAGDEVIADADANLGC